MISLGIRASAKEIFYSIINDKETGFEIIIVDKLVIPQALKLSDKLCFARTNIFSIIKEYRVKIAGIRISEVNAITSNIQSTIERLYYEGVILELLSNCTVDNYFSGRKQFIASMLDEKVEKITEYIDGLQCYDIEDWDSYYKQNRETLLIALAASEALKKDRGVV